MTALEQGAKMGIYHLRRVYPKDTTVSQFGAIARTCASRQYKTPEKQKEFVKGWLAATQQYHHLFKDYPTQRRIRGVILECLRCGSVVEVEYEETEMGIKGVYKEMRMPCPVCME
jgi:hypothetical protein